MGSRIRLQRIVPMLRAAPSPAADRGVAGRAQPESAFPRTGALAALGALLVLLSLAGSPRARADIPNAPGVRTEKDCLKDKLAWLQRNIVAAFEKSGKKDAPWNAQARRFLDDSCLYTTFQDNAPDLAKLEQEMKALSAAGCDDPLVLCWSGQVLLGKKECAAAEETLRKSLAGLEKGAYPKTATTYATRWLSRALRDRPGTLGEAERLTSRTLEMLAGAMTDGDFGANGAQLVYRQFYEVIENPISEGNSAQWAGVMAILKKLPDADPWLMKIVEGNQENGLAWRSRGGGWAYGVSDQGWKGFAEHMEQARDALTAAWKLHPERPEAAARMIRVTMTGHGNEGDTTHLWLERAAQAQIDYGPAYRSALWALLPSWGGGAAEMEELGLQCLATERFDTRVPLLYLTALRGVSLDSPGESARAVFHRPGVHERLQRMFEGMLAANPQAHDRDWLLAQQAVFASRCGEYETAARLLKALRPGVNLMSGRFVANPFLPSDPTDVPLALAEVRAFTGPQKETLRQAEELALGNDLEQAITLFKQAMEASKDDPQVYAYLRDRVAIDRMEVDGGMWQGRTALHVAAGEGYIEMATALVERGAALDDEDPRPSCSPLHCAARDGHASIAALLLEKGAKPSVPDRDFWTPLHHAAHRNNPAVARLLIEHGADATLQTEAGYTPLGLAISQGHLDLANMLIPEGEGIDRPCAGENTPLAWSVKRGLTDLVTALVGKGANPNAAPGNSWTALSQAAYYGRLDYVRLFVEKGADVNAANKTKWTPLNAAATRGNLEIVRYLLDRGADPNIASTDQWTPLLSATHNAADFALVRLLLDKGADANARGKGNWTPLLMAAYYGDTATVRLLLDKGADPKAATEDGRTALAIARNRKAPGLVQILSQDTDPVGIP